MADWKAQISYNYNPSYHAYAYGLVYQSGPEPNHGNPGGWGEAGVTDWSNYNAGVTQAYYAAAAAPRTREESPPHSPEQQAVNGHGHYQATGVYLGDPQAGRLPRTHDASQAGSDSTSDSEAHASPNSWSSGSSREGSLPQTDSTTWRKTETEAEERDNEASCRSPDASGSQVDEPSTFAASGNQDTNTTSVHLPSGASKKPCTSTANTPKGKMRAAFSESQMSALVQRFSIQRYLTPAEMKNLAEMTGLTYKQVKTWFQNRRMKLRRHQKDTSWVSERYNKGSPIHGAMYANGATHMTPYQGEVRPRLKENYNLQMMETAFKKTAPQNMAFYLAAMGSAAGSAGYPSWSPGASQNPMPHRPQMACWSMPPGGGHYEYNPNAFHPASATTANNAGEDMSLEGKGAAAVNSHGSLNTSMVHNGQSC
uniref:Nanog homeobox n=1 Tax=Gasterosteus aculeatus aculeatus TaxID=481459 RepID=G3NCA1_GASAC|nr:homeobox protein NANOG [Gasterosteus aculeatus aculeatus]